MEFYLKQLNLNHTLRFLQTDYNEHLWAAIKSRELELPPSILKKILECLGDTENALILKAYIKHILSQYPSDSPLERYKDAIIRGNYVEIYDAMLKVLDTNSFDIPQVILDEISDYIDDSLYDVPAVREFVEHTLQEVSDHIQMLE